MPSPENNNPIPPEDSLPMGVWDASGWDEAVWDE